MLAKARQNKKRGETPIPMVLEVYQNKNFVSESLSSVCASAIAITADGQVNKRKVDNAKNCHIQPDLPLPTLKERCAVSQLKELHALSKQLAERKKEREKGKETDRQSGLGKTSIPRYRSQYTSKNVTGVPAKGTAKPLYANPMATQSPVPAQGKYKEQEPIKEPRHMRKKYKKTRSTQHYVKHIPSDTSGTGHYETADSVAEDAIKQIKRKTIRSKKQSRKRRESVAECVEPVKCVQQKIVLKTSKIIKKSIKATWLAIKTTMQTFDDWHVFTALLIVGAFAHMIYILCYDINEYVNEELRYMALMRKSGVVLKCFYYVMRLLRVQMF